MKQYSDEWWSARIGKVTASRVIDILPSRKTGAYSAKRKDYLTEKLTEKLTGKVKETFVSKDMLYGTETEPLARSAYEIITGYEVEEVGFIDHPTIKGFGASPDGKAKKIINLEIKCPKPSTHIEVFLANKIDYKYKVQMIAQMMCSGLELSHYIDYDPRQAYPLDFVIIPYPIDEGIKKIIEMEVLKFNAELSVKLTAVESRTKEIKENGYKY